MQKLNKRGLSEVVTAILVILLVLVAITVVWTVVSNFMNQGKKGAENLGDCALIQMQITSAKSISLTAYSIALTRPATGSVGPATITKVRLNFVNDAGSGLSDPTVSLSEGGSVTLPTVTPSTLVGIAKTVSVTPILANGALCDVKDTETIVSA